MESEPVLASAIIFSDTLIRDQMSGKLTLIGVFHRFICLQTPFTSPSFFATVLITNMSGKIEAMPVSMNIEDAAGRVISSANGYFSTSSPVTRHDIAEIGFPLPQITFEKPGQYKAVVMVGGEPLGQRTFNVTINP